MQTKKLYLLGVLIGLVVAGGIAWLVRSRQDIPTPLLQESAYNSWITVAPPQGLFSARLPSAPQESHDAFSIPDSSESVMQDTYTAKDSQGNVYFISTAVYPIAFDLEKNEEALRTALEGMVSALEGSTLLSSQMLNFKSTPSLDFVIQDAGKILHQGKLLIQERTLYQIFVSYDEEALDENDYRYFLTSFNLGQ